MTSRPAGPTDDTPIRPVPFQAVRLHDSFWAPRVETNRAVTIPWLLEQCAAHGRIRRFDQAAAALRGEMVSDPTPGLPCDDTDLYKLLEASAYVLALRPDPGLETRVDSLIAKIAAAQEPDGYLYTARTMAPDGPFHRWSGERRWERETDLSHELYNLGHLYQAAAAHYRATGKRSLLDIALRTADLLIDTFGPGKRSLWPGHQVTEMGLVELYRITRQPAYLELARLFLERRGPDGKPRSGVEYNQSHCRVVDQTEAVGHAVHATYMYAGMAEVAAFTGAVDYVTALDRIWEDLTAHKLYLTGGIGACASHEGFGPPDALANLTAFNETCAAIGLVYWCHRMFLLHGRACAIDVLERVLYNALLASVSLDGQTFFYANPLESFGEYARRPWFECACCPGNLARFLASVSGYFYAQRGSTVYVNLFATGSAEIALADGRSLTLVQETRYPWDGVVQLRVTAPPAGKLTLKLRIPGWARQEVVPSDLYAFAESAHPQPTLALNGAPLQMEPRDGYVTLERAWHAGDQLRLTLPMPVRRVLPSSRVSADRGRMALQRGPIVYAVEGVDHSRGEVLNLVVADDARLESALRPELLGGVVTVSGRATRLRRTRSASLEREPVAFTAIPYYAWANRGRTEMLVWLPRAEEAAWIRPAPTIASESSITLSGGDCPRAANDQFDPASSRDESHKRTRLEPDRDGNVWIEYWFARSTCISEASVFWFESTDWRKESSPRSWRLLYREGDRWNPVLPRAPYGTELDRYQRVTFVPVVTTGLRLEATPQPQSFIGLLEWQVR